MTNTIFAGHHERLYGDTSSAAATAPTGSTLTTAPTAAASTGVTSPLSINLIWDASTATAPAAFKTAMIAAANELESLITTPATINIDVGYGEIAGSAMASGALGESSSYLISVPYSALLSALAANNTSATSAAVLASLPATCPVSGTVCVTTAEAKALGLISSTSTATDAYLGFSASLPFTYNDTNGVTANTYDFTGVALHELTETMGRVMLTGADVFGDASYSLLDLLHYSGPGTRDVSASTAGYFSANGGTTNGGNFNTVAGGDAADWASSMGNNSYDAFLNSGVTASFTSGDLAEMNALGWKLATATPTPPPPPIAPPTGLTITPVTSDAALQGGSKLNASKALMSFTETGGKTGDKFTYSLSGSGAAAFTLSNGTLSTASAGAAGVPTGKLYALNVTITDTTANVSSAPQALDIIAGSTGQADLALAKLTGFSATTPCFIYPGSGNAVSIDATGLTARATFFAGTGTDTFTGGTGPNTYIFGSPTDSIADIIRNFQTAKDTIDFSGLSTHLTLTTTLVRGGLTANSIFTQTSGGDTYIYANTSNTAETLTNTNMRVELLGTLKLTTANFMV